MTTEVAVLLVSRYCTGCAAESRFELLGDCADHGVDCPEIICVECGAVYLCGPWTEVDVVDDSPRASSRSTSAA